MQNYLFDIDIDVHCTSLDIHLGLGCFGPWLKWFWQFPPRGDRIVLRSPLFCRERHCLLLKGAGVAHQAQEGWGGRVFRGSCSSHWGLLDSPRLRRTQGSFWWRAWWSSRGTWRRCPPRGRSTPWRSCPSSLRGRRRRGPVQFPPDRRPAKPLADACCCASMQRSGNWAGYMEKVKVETQK